MTLTLSSMLTPNKYHRITVGGFSIVERPNPSPTWPLISPNDYSGSGDIENERNLRTPTIIRDDRVDYTKEEEEGEEREGEEKEKNDKVDFLSSLSKVFEDEREGTMLSRM